MPYYVNEKCPVCEKPFDEHDDIVTCPHCGTPGNPTDAGKEMAIDFIETE